MFIYSFINIIGTSNVPTKIFNAFYYIDEVHCIVLWILRRRRMRLWRRTPDRGAKGRCLATCLSAFGGATPQSIPRLTEKRGSVNQILFFIQF